ncbi:hypothetical protein SUDANB6_03357 [Streptomyces sp. enrichment culture]|uniref:hypothetical protein n=1 Tax=Streptomyces sp. enrichment culture TaxID=1795815 RepID=UPI003F5579B2
MAAGPHDLLQDRDLRLVELGRRQAGTALALLPVDGERPGAVAVLSVVAVYVPAHNALHTCIAAFPGEHRTGGSRGIVPPVPGIASVAGVSATRSPVPWPTAGSTREGRPADRPPGALRRRTPGDYSFSTT